MDCLNRVGALRKIAFESGGFDCYLIFNNTNLLYFLGFQGSAALLVTADGESIVYVYGVNYEQAKVECKDFRVELIKPHENLLVKIVRQVKDRKIKRVAVDTLGVDGWLILSKEFSEETLEVNNSFIAALRMVKDTREIELMRKAGELTSAGMKAAYETIQPGVKECEVAAEIEHTMRIRGAGTTAFETIVASGIYSAFPHGGCSERIIHEGDLVVVDIGATYKFYCSDMSRTFVAGTPTAKQQTIYNVVNTAQENAFKTIQASVPIFKVDAAARQVIEAAGFGEYFVHRLGHGVGLDVHEPPSLNQLNKDSLFIGNVVTIEPGIYIPGFGGIRIEDTVLVQKSCVEKFTNGLYSLTPE